MKSKASIEDVISPPISSELFNAEQLERHGINLALSHRITKTKESVILLDRLSISEATLIKSCEILSKKNSDSDGFSPAREWLLDNFYLIQEQIQTIRRNLPKGYGKSLPQLAGSLKGYPRVYDIALQLIVHGDGRWDLENLNRFIRAYQSITYLTLGELWAIPITLGIAMIENLSNASKRIVTDRNDYKIANLWADKMIEVAASDPKKLVIIIADMARSEPKMSNAFVAELARRLQAAALALPLSWIEQHLAEEGLSIEYMVQEETKHQAANLVTITSSIAGLRNLGEVDWRKFVESVSIVEEILKKDPTSTYGNMNFETRDRYRHVIETLSRRCFKTEKEVAEASIQLANIQCDNKKSSQDINHPDVERFCHVGYYLIGKGLPLLKRELKIRYGFFEKLCQFCRQCAPAIYIGSILVITGGLVFALVYKAHQSGVPTIWLFCLGILVAVFGSQLGVALVNLGVSLLVKPETLPKMDFSKEIPSSFRTLVVIPGMLGTLAGIETLVEGLEVRFLGNKDKHLQFALLTDFNDAKEEQSPKDAELLHLAETKINELNARYCKDNNDIFFLFHRRRQWNASENVWMGKERKRGKLADLNNLLRGNNSHPFMLIVGRTASLSEVKYVITLDVDTQLYREAAAQFVGTMAHPLNRGRVDSKRQIVVEGYGILQPRMAEALPSKGPNRYTWLYGNEFGIDPYTRTVSEVYQDVFHEGSFVGKGIYDVDLFQQVLEKRFPDNRILSHDLLEGCYLHSGYLSDVPLYEKSPSSYLADVKRRIRWIRGDWQNALWLFPNVLNEEGQRVKNPLSLLSKFKIFDNLRRSLVAPALLFLLVLNWTILPDLCYWMGIIFIIVVLPAVANSLLEFIRKPIDMLLSQHVVSIAEVIQKRIAQLILYLSCLPHETGYSLNAIVRTLWRINISKRHLLEWTPSDQVEKTLGFKKTEWIVNMWMGPATALVSFIILVTRDSLECLFFASPLLLLWLTSPFIARYLSLPIPQKEPKLEPSQIRFLHRMARRTWGFFDTFITAEDHWLPPDNFQEAPVEKLARRTSPTNIGLALLATLTAYDFGYINVTQLLERIRNTLQTLSKLERYRGHLYNWYSTETLRPLLPRYISTVDSGNLAGHLLTLRQGLLELPQQPLLHLRYLDGLEDTLDVLISNSENRLNTLLENFGQLLKEARKSFSNWDFALKCLDALCEHAKKITEVSNSEWSEKLLLECRALREEVRIFSSIPGLDANATLREVALLNQTPGDANLKAIEAIELIETMAKEILSLTEMEIDFLVDESSHLMTIGFNVEEQRRDSSSYDLLSSEARLGTFVAIATGKLQQDSWFSLGRLLASSGGEPILISWSGSMFEYLMPLLVMPTYPGTLLSQTYHTAVKRQIAYGKQRGLPWGVSESGFNAVDTQFNYLYRAFGVPGLGLKRGLEEDSVIAPYASALALMVEPELACENLQHLAQEYEGAEFGFYEAIDFTLSRLPRDGSKRALVRSFMTHHQSMILLAFSYLLHKQPMQRRFVADPIIQATLPLLQERIPKPTATYLKIPEEPKISSEFNQSDASMRVFNTPNTSSPQVQILSNGRYHLVLTQAGSGYSRFKDIALTRWREDFTSDNFGMYSYIRDMGSSEFCSTTYQPTTGNIENFRAVFTEAHAEFYRNEMGLDMHTEIVVSPEDDVELRRLRIHNRSKSRRTIEFTSYAEIVLAPQAADLLQPAFSNLFVETEILQQEQAILATRRPRDENEKPLWLCNILIVYTEHYYKLSFETDRALFVGRGQSLAHPIAMIEQDELSNTSGAVLDPIAAIRCRLRLEPDSLVIFDLLTGVADTRENCVALVKKYQDRRLANRIFELAWTHGQVLLHQLNITESDAQLYCRLANNIIYGSNRRRADPRILASNRRGQSALWSYSISGDLPIVLLYIEDATNIELVKQLIQAHHYWRRKGLLVDLIILNQERISYRHSLQDQIMSLITASTTTDHAGSIVLRVAEQIPSEDIILFQSVARIILSDKNGSLQEQISRRRVNRPSMPILNVIKSYHISGEKLEPLPELQFFNGFGGFTATDDEYIVRISEGHNTPAPWVNIIANPNFGTLLSESGQGYTWSENAHEFRLTPWDNDPIQDSAGEACYIRDDITGHSWSPTPLPCRGSGDYQTRHGFGYSVFEHIEDGIHSELWIFVAKGESLKFSVLRLHNKSTQNRRLSVFGYVAWVLGDLRAKNAMHVMTELSPTGVLLAENHYNTDFPDRTVFFDADTSHFELKDRSITGDRTEFLGRNGSLQNPAALKRKRLSGRVGAGFDPCGAIQLSFDLGQDQSREIVFTLGAGRNKEEALILADRYNGVISAKLALESVRQHWQKMLNKVRVTTPDPTVNLLTNGWLIYQLLSSRLWGRSGYYQSGGAFGFRDQLQDVLALSHIAPELFRAQLLLCAAHQFEEGDVQHWWHPPHNRGVRTRCSDDYLWLPFAIIHYIETTDDMAVLDEVIPFLQGRPLKEDEESYYELPSIGIKKVTLFQHAVRAINNGLKFGAHGLPLMGSGDWNDGMNLVGKKGKGESIWLGFFLYCVLKRFAPLAARYGDNAFASRCEAESSKLQKNLETHGWDGEWYLRAYFDDGTPMGSKNNSECRIDSIAQSWSILSGASDPNRAKQAMAAVLQYLVDSDDRLVKLLSPPFNKSKPNPGYIEGYVPGIRENGGQYTHAAVWAAMAFATLNEKELSWRLFHILNPINHGRNTQEIERYKIEPYVIAADVYSVAPHIGRGGWSWYTGSAGWFYRLITETLLGIHLEKGSRLRLNPILQDDWDGFKIHYRFGDTQYEIAVNRVSVQSSITLDKIELKEDYIVLQDDGQLHHVFVNING